MKAYVTYGSKTARLIHEWKPAKATFTEDFMIHVSLCGLAEQPKNLSTEIDGMRMCKRCFYSALRY